MNRENITLEDIALVRRTWHYPANVQLKSFGTCNVVCFEMIGHGGQHASWKLLSYSVRFGQKRFVNQNQKSEEEEELDIWIWIFYGLGNRLKDY